MTDTLNEAEPEKWLELIGGQRHRISGFPGLRRLPRIRDLLGYDRTGLTPETFQQPVEIPVRNRGEHELTPRLGRVDPRIRPSFR